MSGMHDFTLASARDALKARKISAVELTNAHLDAIERLDGRLNSFITRTPDQARVAAKAADDVLAKGEGGALTGIPLGIKDLFCTNGVRTTAASKILGNFVPPYESTVTSNLLRDGAVFLGKLNLDEFAMGSANLNSAFGPVENPWKRNGSDAKLVPGGSSGEDKVSARTYRTREASPSILSASAAIICLISSGVEDLSAAMFRRSASLCNSLISSWISDPIPSSSLSFRCMT